MGKTHVTLGDRTTNWTHFHCELGALVGLGSPKGLWHSSSQPHGPEARVKDEQLAATLLWASAALGSGSLPPQSPGRGNSSPI